MSHMTWCLNLLASHSLLVSNMCTVFKCGVELLLVCWCQYFSYIIYNLSKLVINRCNDQYTGTEIKMLTCTWTVYHHIHHIIQALSQCDIWTENHHIYHKCHSVIFEHKITTYITMSQCDIWIVHHHIHVTVWNMNNKSPHTSNVTVWYMNSKSPHTPHMSQCDIWTGGVVVNEHK